MRRRPLPAPIFRSTAVGRPNNQRHEQHPQRAAARPGGSERRCTQTQAHQSRAAGGGAHGAFTWGVLEQRLSIEGISGTSAGAMNAVMLADGLLRGGRDEAQKRLADFWRAVSSTGNLTSLQREVMERLLSFTPLEG